MADLKMWVSDMFAPVPGFPGYWVSQRGEVLTMRLHGGRGVRKPSRRILKQRPHPRTGHMRVDLKRIETGKRNYTTQVQRIVAWAWIGPRPDGTIVCHKDGIPENNHVSNIYYGTHKQNAADAAFHRQNRGQVRADCPDDRGLIYEVNPEVGF